MENNFQKIMNHNNIEPEEIKKEDGYLDQALRPSLWVDYIGQETIKKNLEILLRAAKARESAPEHILFYGPPGLGKTTLSYLVAKEMGTNMKITSGPAIMKVGDLAAILTNLANGDILFIDEIHRLNKLIEEVLYPAMESGKLDIIIGKGPSARTIQLELPNFTLIGATTRISLLSSPLRSRFSGGIHRLQYYTEKEIAEIVKRSAKILKIKITDGAAQEIAKRSRFTPRLANYFLKRCRDYAEVNQAVIDEEVVKNTLEMLEIDEIGLGVAEKMYLKCLGETFLDKAIGLNTIAASTGEEEATIEEVVEPYLLQIGFIERTPRGRILTDVAKKYFKK